MNVRGAALTRTPRTADSVLAVGPAAPMRTQGREVLPGTDCTVPLHSGRRRARGFNQAAYLALHLGLPMGDALRRVGGTRPQVDLPAAQRHGTIRGVCGRGKALAAAHKQAGPPVIDLSCRWMM